MAKNGLQSNQRTNTVFATGDTPLTEKFALTHEHISSNLNKYPWSLDANSLSTNVTLAQLVINLFLYFLSLRPLLIA